MCGALIMKHEALVTRIHQEAPNIMTIFFTIDNDIFNYIAGQYVSVYFEQTGEKNGKAYSLSSSPRDDELSMTVKRVGVFSGLLCALKPGDYFQVSSPYGFFNAHDDAPIVAIAAGVGISPIWSIIRDELATNAARAVTLYLTAPYENELTFRRAVDNLFSSSPLTSAHYFVTREASKVAEQRRFNVARDIKISALSTSRFYVCGSEDFVRGIWRQLMEAGVDEAMIVTETFFESNL